MGVLAYDKRFFDDSRETVLTSARITAPIVMEMFHPTSVVDVGCGIGAWLAAFAEVGVDDFLGIDGDYVDRLSLMIPAQRFIARDLTHPINIDRRFDLVLSLEVAEHLPASCARHFIETLTSLGSIVLFSAAIPFQSGEHHINEQWPEYWAEMFADSDFAPVDCIRRRIWWNRGVLYWYAQNLIVYAHKEIIRSSKRLTAIAEGTDPASLAVVHPACYLGRIGRAQMAYKWIRSHAPRPLRTVLRSLTGLNK